MRIVSHTASNTEIVAALGLDHHLVGVDDHSDYPPDLVASLPRIGPDLGIDVARVKALNPDLVLTSLTLPGHEKTLAALRDAGLPLLVMNPISLDDIAGDIERIAKALGAASRGRELATRFRAALRPAASAGPPLPVLVEWWPKPVIVPGRDSWVNPLLHLAGAYNPWQSAPEKSLAVETSEVVSAAPEAIVIAWCGVPEHNYRPEIVRRRPGWAAVPAVRNGRIFPVSEAWLGRPGPRLTGGLDRLRRIVAGCRFAAGRPPPAG